MAEQSAGVAGFAELGITTGTGAATGMGQLDAATWTWVIFALAVGFLVFVYFGFGGLTGSVKS